MAETLGNAWLLALAIAPPRQDVAIAPLALRHNSSINIRHSSDKSEQSIYNPDRTCIVANHINDDDSIYSSFSSLWAPGPPSSSPADRSVSKSHPRKNPRLGYQPERGSSLVKPCSQPEALV
ncbi:MAG: hypothetical protein HC910_21270 [Spirulinaceae cyanobacterium SM2_1_0]|nr:hypothetical protein [Spirulinaceae cyanobacterium SM2_1_0]